MFSAVRLHVEQHGKGERTLVFLHGFGGSARNFRPQIRHLESSHSVVAFDLRGHARSEAPADPSEYEPEAFVDDLARVLHEVHAERSVVVCGVSLGASIALRFALAHPQSLDGLVLASFPSGDAKARAWAIDFADAIERVGLERAGEQFVWSGDRFDVEAGKLIKLGFLEHPAHALAAILRRVLARFAPVSEIPGLGDLDVRTLLIAGKKDAASVRASEALERALPKSVRADVPESGHVVNLEKAKLFNEVMDAFLSNL